MKKENLWVLSGIDFPKSDNGIKEYVPNNLTNISSTDHQQRQRLLKEQPQKAAI